MSSECSSIPDAKYFNNKYKYPGWFTRKKYIFHNKMLKRLRKLRYLHSRASQYYEKMNLRLSAPSIIITALSGIASFMSTSQYVNNDSQNAFGISVGVMASLSSIFQAFSAACQYSVKKEAHRTVAEQYNALIVKTKFEMEMPNEEDFIDKLEQAILDIQAKCNYFVPQFIIDEWSKKELKEGSDAKNNLTDFKQHTDHNISMFYEDDTDANENEKTNDNKSKSDEITTDKNDESRINVDKLKKEDSHDNNMKESLKINESTYLLDESLPQINLMGNNRRNEPHIKININEADLDSLNKSDRSSYTLSPQYVEQNKNNLGNSMTSNNVLNTESTLNNRSSTI